MESSAAVSSSAFRVLLATGLALLCLCAPTVARAALPDGRAYEMVTPVDKNGLETGPGVPSVNGDKVNWEAPGGCCGATSAAFTLYQSKRSADGSWQTGSLTPTPSTALVGLFAEQNPLFFSSDLSKTIFTTPASYDAANVRPLSPSNSPYLDLYLQDGAGNMTWLTRGPFAGSGTGPFVATFSAATPDGNSVLFNTTEQLTPNATGLADLNTPAQFLYVRNVAAGTTELVNVDNSGNLLDEWGAIGGDGWFLGQSFLPANVFGTTTNAISSDGSKVFFEDPPGSQLDLPPGVVSHVYMRDLSTNTTTPLDDPTSSVPSRYEGASQDGSLVYFSSAQGINGGAPDNELYVFNTTDQQIGEVSPMTAVPVSGGNVETTQLTAGATGHRATTLSADALGTVTNSLAHGVGPDANTTLTAPANAALATTLSADAVGATTTALSHGAGPAVSTTLVADAGNGDSTIQVDDGSDLASGESITIGSGGSQETATIDSVGSAGVPSLDSTFGSSGSGDGEFSSPAGAAVDQSNGDVYVVDAGNFRVEKFDSSGSFLTAFGSQGSNPGEFTSPAFVAVDNSPGGNGDVYVGDPGDSIVTKFDSDGNIIGGYGTGGQLDGISASFGSIDGIAVDSSGNLFVINSGNSVYEFDQSGAAVTNFPTVRGMAATGLAVDGSGNLFKVNGDNTVEKVDSTGADIGQVSTGSATGITVDPSTGSLFVNRGSDVAEYDFDGSGNVLQSGGGTCAVAPNTGCSPTLTFASGTLSAGTGVAVNSGTSTDYAVDAGNSNVAIFVPPAGGTPVTLTAGLANDHANGEDVTHAADSSIDVDDATGFANGQDITIGAESATIASVSGSTINLNSALANAHPTGDPVSYAGDTSIEVGDTTGFAAGQEITIDPSGTSETATIDTVTDGTHLALTAPLSHNHASGADVTQGGASTLTVADTTNFVADEPITIGSGGSAETATIASVDDATHITLTHAVTNDHASSEPVSHTADTSIEVGDTTGLSGGQQITIGDEAATIASVTDGTHLALSAAVTATHAPGTTVTRAGDSSIAVADSSGFSPGQQISVGSESATIDSLPDATHIALTGPLGDAHDSGDAVTYDGDKTLEVQNSARFSPGNEISIDTGGAQEDATVDSVPDGTHLVLTAGVTNDHASGATVTRLSSALGDVLGETAISNDGSHVFFIARGVLDSGTNNQGQSAQDGQANFYDFNVQTGHTTFITVLADSDAVDPNSSPPLGPLVTLPDVSRLAVPTADGSVLLFESTGNLTGDDPSGFYQIYRYATGSGSLSCVSCPPAGVDATGPAAWGTAGGGSYAPPFMENGATGSAVPMSSDGSRIFFDSPDPLVSTDVNTGVFANGLFGTLTRTYDVYEWVNGDIRLISDGRSTTGSLLNATTPSGNDVFFSTRAQLVSTDTDGFDDIYDARVGGISPPPASGPSVGCDGDNCRPSTAPTAFFNLPASASLTGQGNPAFPSAKFPTFKVASISAKQRKRFARTGVLSLKVSATGAGKLTARARAKIGKKTKTIASASKSVVANEKATLTLRLSKAARRALAKKRKLKLGLTVSYSESDTVKAAKLTLKASKANSGAKS